MRRKDNAWSFRVDAGIDSATGKRVQVAKQGFRTKREAEAALNEVVRSLQEGSGLRRSQTTLGDFLDDWLAVQRQRIRPTTWHGYEMAVKRINRSLGKAKLQAITPLQIEKFYSTLLASGGRNGKALAPKTVRNTHVVLRKALSDAERLELVQRNAAVSAKAPTSQRPEHLTWSSDELREFLVSIRDDRLHAAFVLAATTGMRRGEVLGLRWGDLDFDAGQLAVAHTITTAGDELVYGPPKTARSRRQIFLDDSTLRVLREQRKRQQEDRL